MDESKRDETNAATGIQKPKRMQKRVIFALTVASLLFAFFIYSAFFSSDYTNAPRQYGKRIMDEYTAAVENRVVAELGRLFHDLDENKDGSLSLSEFTDKRLALAA